MTIFQSHTLPPDRLITNCLQGAFSSALLPYDRHATTPSCRSGFLLILLFALALPSLRMSPTDSGVLSVTYGTPMSCRNSELTLLPCRLVKTSAEIDAASAQGIGMQKSSRDFIKRVAAVSGITSACGVPERAQHAHSDAHLFEGPWPLSAMFRLAVCIRVSHVPHKIADNSELCVG